MSAHVEIPLFPLSTVLFPGGPLQLRIFEPRYLAMVRECARSDSAFGVCLILSGREAGLPAEPAAVGTLARISDFYTLPDGLLGIGAVGGARFRALRTRVREDGLLLGTIELWADEPAIAVPPEFGLLATILERLTEQLEPAWRDAPRANYDDAVWVGFRLAELLPLGDGERQQLLELTDPVARLGQLTVWLPRFQRP
ncbi:MAG TPA: LON peptidase substrate-binding domain-containing protein [Rhodanobacteraceae bacterium]|nr:LON peptidase substrate-binding domain-containing protein [Rhodanobacteraceae bacterium]